MMLTPTTFLLACDCISSSLLSLCASVHLFIAVVVSTHCRLPPSQGLHHLIDQAPQSHAKVWQEVRMGYSVSDKVCGLGYATRRTSTQSAAVKDLGQEEHSWRSPSDDPRCRGDCPRDD